MFVALEGIDGSGKTTLGKKLYEQTTYHGCHLKLLTSSMNRPVRGLYRKLIGQESTFPSPLTSLLLSLSDYSWLLDNELKEETQSAYCDRYVYSSLADAFALGISKETIFCLHCLFPPSTVSLFINTSPQIALNRKESLSLAETGGPTSLSIHGRSTLAFLDFQSRVAQGYQTLISLNLLGDHVIVLDGDQAEDELFRDAASALRGFFGSHIFRVEALCCKRP